MASLDGVNGSNQESTPVSELRSRVQSRFFHTGCLVHQHPGKVLFLGILALVTLCLPLKSVTIETNLDTLWVEEDGRLEKELHYIKTHLGEGIGNTDQLLIQTTRGSNVNILTPFSLLHHKDVLEAATSVTVELFEVTWKLKDICVTPSIPSFEDQTIEKLIDGFFPCSIMSVLDCFWEGSYLLGPDHGFKLSNHDVNLKWSNINPKHLVSLVHNMSEHFGSFRLSTVEDMMSRAGITSGYQEKPCLNPRDPRCPKTSPNKDSTSSMDIGSIVTGGCYGFATKFMHWPEDLIIGGIKKNRTGHVVKATALQSIIQMMGEQDLYQYWVDDYKVHNIEWSVEKAKLVLHSWQRKFTQKVIELTRTSPSAVDVDADTFEYDRPRMSLLKKKMIQIDSKLFHYSPFTSNLLLDIMHHFSLINPHKMVITMVSVIVFTIMVGVMCHHIFVSIFGMILLVVSITSGLGVCSLLRIPFNATSCHITPFLSIAIGSFFLFQMIHCYSQNQRNQSYFEDTVGEVLQQIGPMIVMMSISCIIGLVSSAIIPIPAMRTFCLQLAIIMPMITVTLLLLLPCVMSLDMRRIRSGRKDLLCCITKKVSPPTMPSVPLNNLSEGKYEGKPFLNQLNSGNRPRGHQDDPQPQEPSPADTSNEDEPANCILDKVITSIYLPLLDHTIFRFMVISAALMCLVTSLRGIPMVHDGLDLTDIVPHGTMEHEFLRSQSSYFSFYHMFAVTEGNLEYPMNQKLLLEYHHSFTRISKIIKNDDGGLPDFWLVTFREWLKSLQTAFDQDRKMGLIDHEGWKPNASINGILGYRLLIQTGRNDEPIDKTLVNKIKLVDSHGIINPKAFYTYLSAWATNDAFAYYASQGNLRPAPREWVHLPSDNELKIPKSQPLVFTQMPFYLHDMNSTDQITDTISQIRSICDRFQDKGLPNFPTGIPFIFWEQYMRLNLYFMSSLVLVSAVVFLLVATCLFNPWAASLVVTMSMITVMQMYGWMGIIGIPFSAVPAVILIMSIGLGTLFYLPITMSFLTILGSRSHRMKVSTQKMAPPMIYAFLSATISVAIMSISEFDFIVKYFFYVVMGFLSLGIFYGLMVLPILLSLLGLPCEIVPFDRRDRTCSPPSPPSSPYKRRSSSSSTSSSSGGKKVKNLPSHYFSRKEYPRVQSDISLSTIPEESHQYQSSHEIIVQPELVVETTTITNAPSHPQYPFYGSDPKFESSSPETDHPESPISRDSPMSDTSSSGASSMSRPNSAPSSTMYMPQTVTTKVTTTAKLKLELHTPHSYYDRDRDRDHLRSESSSSCSSMGNKRPKRRPYK